MGLEDDPVLLLAPRRLLHAGVEMIAPPLPALLAEPPVDVVRYGAPALRPQFSYKVPQCVVLFTSPRLLHETGLGGGWNAWRQAGRQAGRQKLVAEMVAKEVGSSSSSSR